jgi:hypothetical protein
VRDGTNELINGTLWSKLPFVAQVLARPRWLLAYLADGGLMNLPNVAMPGGPLSYADVGKLLAESAVTWGDLDWICEEWNGPIIVKGCIRRKTPAVLPTGVSTGLSCRIMVAQIHRLALSDAAPKLPGVARYHRAGFPNGHDRSACLSLGRMTGFPETDSPGLTVENRAVVFRRLVPSNSVPFTNALTRKLSQPDNESDVRRQAPINDYALTPPSSCRTSCAHVRRWKQNCSTLLDP